MKKIITVTIILCLNILAISQSEITTNDKGIIQFEKELTNILSEYEPGTAISITQGDKIIYEKYIGMANLAKCEKLNKNHVMGIASMSKQFLGMAILILEQDGKLKLDENIGMYFPDLPIADRKISIKQLLSHTSGLPELTQNEEFMGKIDQPHTVNQIIELAFKSEFRSEVGEKFMYCNTGYTIAVALIEKLSGMKYADFLKRNIFEPLNMKNTFSCDYQQDATLAVQRYEPDSLSFKKAIDMHFSNLIGGGAIISNVQDMAKWCMALLSGKNLPENYQKLWEPVLLNSGESTEYGLGLGISDYEGIKFYYHPGMGSGMNSIDLIFPDQNISISVIRNISTPKVPSKDIALLAAKYLLTKNQH